MSSRWNLPVRPSPLWRCDRRRFAGKHIGESPSNACDGALRAGALLPFCQPPGGLRDWNECHPATASRAKMCDGMCTTCKAGDGRVLASRFQAKTGHLRIVATVNDVVGHTGMVGYSSKILLRIATAFLGFARAGPPRRSQAGERVKHRRFAVLRIVLIYSLHCLGVGGRPLRMSDFIPIVIKHRQRINIFRALASCRGLELLRLSPATSCPASGPLCSDAPTTGDTGSWPPQVGHGAVRVTLCNALELVICSRFVLKRVQQGHTSLKRFLNSRRTRNWKRYSPQFFASHYMIMAAIGEHGQRQKKKDDRQPERDTARFHARLQAEAYLVARPSQWGRDHSSSLSLAETTDMESDSAACSLISGRFALFSCWLSAGNPLSLICFHCCMSGGQLLIDFSQSVGLRCRRCIRFLQYTEQSHVTLPAIKPTSVRLNRRAGTTRLAAQQSGHLVVELGQLLCGGALRRSLAQALLDLFASSLACAAAGQSVSICW